MHFKLTKKVGFTRIRARQLKAGHGVNIAGCCCRHDVISDDDVDNDDVVAVVASSSLLHARVQSVSAAHIHHSHMYSMF